MDHGSFQAPDLASWPMASRLSHLEFYKPNKAVTDCLVALSELTITASQGKDCLQTMQTSLGELATTSKSLKVL